MMDDSTPRRSFRASRLLLAPDSILACGHGVDDILTQIADGRARELGHHQQGCSHCQAALSELARVWQPVQELAAQRIHAPVELTARVMNDVHRLVQDVWYTLQLTDLGTVKVAARVVARIAREAARQVPGVRVALGKSSHGRIVRLVEWATQRHRHPHAAVGVLGRTAAVELAVAVQYGDSIVDVGHEVQQRVVQQLRAAIRLESVTVNVTVDDVIL
jgi:uncharacterized alkaline shock family protein YloU